MRKYDLVVVGSGVGLNVLNYGLNFGWRCALVEKDKMGGTCLTRGCIPSKILIYPADKIREAEHSKKIGINFKLEGYNWDLISKRMFSQIDESKDIDQSLSSVDNLDVYKGEGEFSGKYKMKVKIDGNYSDEFKSDRFVLASGGRTFIPPIDGLDKVDYVTSETFFGQKFPKEPYKSLIIIGGGAIGLEFAHLFSAFGTKVTLVEMLHRLANTEEKEISEFLKIQLQKKMNVYTNHKAKSVKLKDGKKVITLENLDNGEEIEIDAQEIFISSGIRSNADLLKVENTKVETDKRGWIKTNQYLETTQKNIWAIGDANGRYQFRHKANYDAEILSKNLVAKYGQKVPVDYSSVPWSIYTYPQVGHVGMTEKEAIDSGHEIYVAKNNYSSVAKGFAMGYSKESKEDGFVKLIVDKSMRILGAHVVGPNAAVLVQPFVYLMNAGYTCAAPQERPIEKIPKMERLCPGGGSFLPIYKSMVIHPSLNEVTAWALGSLRPMNISGHSHHHHH